MTPVLLWTDAALWAIVAGLGLYAWSLRRAPERRAVWGKVAHNPVAACAALVLAVCMVIALLDSLHFRRALPPTPGAPTGTVFYSPKTESLLDLALARPLAMREVSYSAPLATHALAHEASAEGRAYPRLQHGGAHLANAADAPADIARRSAIGLLAGAALSALMFAALARRHGARALLKDRTAIPWRALWLTATVLLLLGGVTLALMQHYHPLGTDQTGNSVLVQALKSIRTAFVIGLLATLATLPLALGLGVLAGYLRGWVDEAIQYGYTVLSSVPNVLLIAACVLMLQVWFDQHPDVFETATERADVKMFLLCVILGLTGWASLCRLVRAETLKLRELDYVQAATAFGVSPWRIMLRHIVPNVMHLVLITLVLSFSELILYEAVLTYVGVGVDASTSSFGGMINGARTEMGREPIVWWSFAAAFGFMVTLVLAANLFADGVRDAFDPRAASLRASRRRRALKVGI